MYRIDNATAVPSGSGLPTPGAVGPNPNGFFTNGVPGVTASTIVDSDWMNAVQEEICSVITSAGLTLSKTSQAQLLIALFHLPAKNAVLFTTSGTWTCPANVTRARLKVWGAGGGSGGASNGGNSGGGGGGGYAEGLYTVIPGTVYTVTTGAGGTAGLATTSPTGGGAGGSSSFGAFVSATGGGGGAASSGSGVSAGGGNGGAGTGGNILNVTGGSSSGGLLGVGAGGGNGGAAWGMPSPPGGGFNGPAVGAGNFGCGAPGTGAPATGSNFAGAMGGGGMAIVEY